MKYNLQFRNLFLVCRWRPTSCRGTPWYIRLQDGLRGDGAFSKRLNPQRTFPAFFKTFHSVTSECEANQCFASFHPVWTPAQQDGAPPPTPLLASPLFSPSLPVHGPFSTHLSFPLPSLLQSLDMKVSQPLPSPVSSTNPCSYSFSVDRGAMCGISVGLRPRTGNQQPIPSLPPLPPPVNVPVLLLQLQLFSSTTTATAIATFPAFFRVSSFISPAPFVKVCGASKMAAMWTTNSQKKKTKKN